MLYLLQKFNSKILSNTNLSNIDKSFNVGDTICVGLKIVDGNTTRVQDFEGVCIAIRKKSIGTNIVVRKISDSIEVERNIPLSSPAIDFIRLVKRGQVRRSKLYYLRGLKGKVARIKDAKIKKNPVTG